MAWLPHAVYPANAQLAPSGARGSPPSSGLRRVSAKRAKTRLVAQIEEVYSVMYETFYGLKADPFRLSPDHRFCFEHGHYAKARAYIDYALHRAEGFVMITGRPGTGKTTLINDLQLRLAGRGVKVAMLETTQLEAEDLLSMTAYAFGLDPNVSSKALILQRLIDFFGKQFQHGRRAVLIIDEAQGLSASALEELRLLTNLQRTGQPLLQIILIGQEALRDLVRRREMEQLHQRLVAAWHLEPLGPVDTIQYVRHRLERAGWIGDPELKPGVFQPIYEFSGGVPRRINLICSRLLLRGYIEELHAITPEDARQVVDELQQEELAPRDWDEPGALGEGEQLARTPGEFASAVDVLNGGVPGATDWSQIDGGLAVVAISAAPLTEVPASPEISGVATESLSPAPSSEHRSADDASVTFNHQVVDERPHPAPALTESADTGAEVLIADRFGFDEPQMDDSGLASSVKHRRGWFVGVGLVLALAGLGMGLYLRDPGALDRLLAGVKPWVQTSVVAVAEAIDGLIEQGHEPVSAESLSSEPSQSPIPLQSAAGARLSTPQEQASERQPASLVDVDQSLPEEGVSEVPLLERPPPLVAAVDAELVGSSMPGRIEGSPPSLNQPESVAEVLDSTTTAPVQSEVPDSTAPVIDRESVAADSSSTEGGHPAETERADAEAPILDSSGEPTPSLPQVLMSKRILFGWNSTEVEARYEPALKAAIGEMKRADHTIAQVVGYADRFGDAAYNLDLSRRRAVAVADYLIKHGISRDRVRVDGQGVLEFDDPTDGVGARDEPQARRVELSILSQSADG